ncbi:lysophospholipid acyltransferase family protein [Desulfovibrio sp. JC022]|uniref:lysophospholipid acyltransferase family protein n=1 Tax=Desulfovibrio sp. JC022 TaxID=2593642 RepID=UPI0013D3157B|nr:GNAT family N-acyltransferase [Desulfovibrio sp. JC022]NDV21518.1 lysophospholipid acyltransferase family protein [Desulfovibrio sp. JC022]
MVRETCSELFSLKSPFEDPFRGALFSLMEKPLSHLLCFPRLNSLYSRVHDEEHWVDNIHTDFASKALSLLGVKVGLDSRELKHIPKSGSSVVVANHPFGVVEGLILMRMLKAVRPDVKIMANFMLGLIPEMKEHLIGVDPFGRKNSHLGNISGLKEAVKWVKGGGLLAVFPAGEVSSLNVKGAKVEDPVWSPTVGGIIKRTGASATPVFFNGRNSFIFQAAGMVHPRLRTVLLPRENLKKKSGPVEFAVGNTISRERLAAFDSNQYLMEYLRFRTYTLRPRFKKKKLALPVFKKKEKPISDNSYQSMILTELTMLGPKSILVENSEFAVHEVHAANCPFVLHEIGRLREKTFRLVGEGTGRSVDVDRFDNTFIHLVLWHKESKEIAGAYRIARADEQIERFGLDGVYSNSFFGFDTKFFDKVSPALELGRSFIRPSFQRNFYSLMMLWKGIAAYLARNPRYRYLFGCVSISNDYKKISRELIADSLMKHNARNDLSELISPARPLKFKKLKSWQKALPGTSFIDHSDLEKIVQDIEGGTGIPVLLRHYLKIGGKLVGFNIDPDFGNSLDGLIVVDLLDTSERSLFKFMGKEQGRGYLDFHHASGGLKPFCKMV